MKPTLLLVHGIFNQGRMFWKMAHHFAQRGYEVHAPDLVPNSACTSLSVLSGQLREYIDTHLPADAPYHLLGFSMGGLVSRHYLQAHAELVRVQSFTTLSSPHNGTLNAWWLPLKGWREMRPGSAFLRQLAANDPRIATHLRPLSIWTPLDLVILPSNSSVWDIADNESFPVPLHPAMRYSRKVIARVERHLGEAHAEASPAPA
jgi:triacylglycerol lipase